MEFLWQKRSDEIDRYPGDWDISAGGHINLGESVVEAAVRETREEVGAKITANEREFVTMRPFNKNRFAWVYLVDWTDRAEEFHFDDKEVSEVRWVEYGKMDEFRKEFAKAPLSLTEQIRSFPIPTACGAESILMRRYIIFIPLFLQSRWK